MSLHVRAPAKLNLFLHITGKRADGYHLLESLVVFTDLADGVGMEPASSLSLKVEGEFASAAGPVEDNLVMKAARALQAHAKREHGAEITLTKNIPVGAGLGGGSADAAVALNGLNHVWKLGLSTEELHAIALTLGADVAMCLDPKPAMVRGIGDRIEPLQNPLPAMAALLVHPRLPLSTKDVYHAYKLPPQAPAAAFDMQNFWSSLESARNHLQPVAIAASPLVAEVLLALETLLPKPRLVRMTGSGACCFALYDTLAEAARAAVNLSIDHRNWWIKPAEIRRS